MQVICDVSVELPRSMTGLLIFTDVNEGVSALVKLLLRSSETGVAWMHSGSCSVLCMSNFFGEMQIFVYR